MCVFLFLSCLFPVSLTAAVLTDGNGRMNTVRTDTTSAAAPLTGRATTTQTITGTAPCLLAPARPLALLAVASTRPSLTLSLGSATLSPCLVLLAATHTVTKGAGARTGRTITIGGAGRRTRRSRGSRRRRGAWDTRLKPRTRPSERRRLQVRGLTRAARPPAPTLLAAPVAPAAAGIVPALAPPCFSSCL